VLCVGDLTLGGTGKTPTVLWLAGRLRAAGRRVAVVSRGYGREGGSGVRVVSDGRALLLDWRAAGDEPVLVASRLPGVPVLVGADRVAAGRRAVEEFAPEVIILDDGFQHRRLHRDRDLVLLDAGDPFGGERLFPRGRLREDPHGLRRAHALLVTRAGSGPAEPIRKRLRSLAPDLPVAWASHRACGLVDCRSGAVSALDRLRGMRFLALSGIARPVSFRQSLQELSLPPAEFLAYPDHYAYGAADLAEIERSARACRAQALVTTEKDAVRLAGRLPAELPAYALRIELEVLEGAEPLQSLLGLPAGGSCRG
jgi:tetraacyldisaccharide 4'-kinase